MNKLYKAGLAVLAIALLTSSALAFSPTWEDPPDVIVGDGDLVFTNAFNWQDYVSDEDTTPITSLQVVFAEGVWQSLANRSLEETDGSTSNEVGINGQTEVDYSGVGGVQVFDPITFDGTTILNGAGWLTFTASSNADRAVVLIASDGATTPVASSAFRVREIAAEVDQLTVPVQKVTLDSWDTDGDWNVGTEWGFISLSLPTSTSGGGSIGITSTDAITNDFAFWQLIPTQTLVPINAGQLVRARWTINGGTAATTAWPSIQMRMFQENNAEFAWTAVSATKYVPAPNTSRTYESFMQPSPELATSGTGLIPAFYLIDTANPGGAGTYSVEELVVDGIVGLDGLFTQEFVIDSGEAIDFDDVFDLYLGSNITSTGSAGSFTYNVTTANALDFATAQFNTGFNMAADTLYRVVSTFSSTQAAASQPVFAVRAFSANNEVTIATQYQPASGVTSHLPDAGGKEYNALLPSTGINGLELRFTFDIYNTTTGSGPITWQNVVVESVPLSNIP